MVGCSVLGCKSRSERQINGISFHLFPSNLDTRSKWVDATKRPNWKPSKHSKICSMHFNNEAFLFKNKMVFLDKNSVPVKNLHQSTSTRRGPTKRRSDVLVPPIDHDMTLPKKPTLLEKQKLISANRLKKLRAVRQSRRRLQKKVDVTNTPENLKRKPQSRKQHHLFKEYANDSTDEESLDIKEETPDEADHSDDDETEISAPVTEKVFVKSIAYNDLRQPLLGTKESSEATLDYTEELYEFGKYVAEQLLCLDVDEARVVQTEICNVLSKNMNNKKRCKAEPSTSDAEPATNAHCSVVAGSVAQLIPVVTSVNQPWSHVNTAGMSKTQPVNTGASPMAPLIYVVVPTNTAPVGCNLTTQIGNVQGKLLLPPRSGSTVTQKWFSQAPSAGTSVNETGSSSKIVPGVSVKTEIDELSDACSHIESQPVSSNIVSSETSVTQPVFLNVISTGTSVTQPVSPKVISAGTSVTEPVSSKVISAGTSVTKPGSSSMIYSEIPVKIEPVDSSSHVSSQAEIKGED